MSDVATAPPQRRARRSRLTAYLFIAPAAIYLLVLMAYPLFEGLRLSFTDTNLLSPRGGEYVGTENYSELISDPAFWRTLRVTLIYTVVSVVGAIGVGLLAALGMNRLTGRSRVLRGLVIIPWAAPMIPVALISAWILDNQYGVLNWFVTKVGVSDGYVQWLDNEHTALPSILAVTIWRVFPFSAVILLAALQGVSADLYEAARIDGASRLNVFKHITLPAIRPTLGVLTLFVTIWSLRRFDLIWVLTEGGPLGSTNTLVIDLYKTAFRNSSLGMGSAIGVVGFVISTAVTAAYFLLASRRARATGATA